MSRELSLSRRVPRLAIYPQTSKTDSEIIIQILCQSFHSGSRVCNFLSFQVKSPSEDSEETKLTPNQNPGEVMRGLLAAHGDSKVAGQEAVSNAKAETIYRILDANSDVYQPVNHTSVRSRMNICFRVGDAATEKEFLEGAEARMLQGLKGHRSVGGIRYVVSVLV